VLRDGEPFLAFGTPGGDQQDQRRLQAFHPIAEFGSTRRPAPKSSAMQVVRWTAARLED